MKNRRAKSSLQFAVCIDNAGYPAALELHKNYRVMPDENAAADVDLRIVDESGEDYLFSAKRFIVMDLPQPPKRALLLSPKTVEKTARKKSSARQHVQA